MGRSDSNNDKRASGRQGGTFRKKSYARGNAPIRKKTEQEPKKPSDPNVIRLNKYVANSGVCSRREADIYISAGSVTVNGKPVVEMGYKVKLTDEVKFDGRLLNPIKKEYVLLNKPKDFTTAARNEHGRRTALGLISKATKTELLPVGKLSKDTTGLLLFTNDGELTKRLNSPKNGLRKIFHVELNKPLRSADLKKIQEGILVDEKVIKVQDISFVDKAPKNQIGMEIFSTRTNIVQRIFETLGYEIVKLDRVVYAGLTKKDLPRGHWRYLTEQEVVNLGMIK
ncbi:MULTISPECIES: pseudouridine synthase [Zobellia]|uniref:pseudouridine synthase n=1 Tax=Zobellia TaxID=112040 RepID=UPI001BFF592B|nr:MULTISPECIES: pseudouridine synthase [Zobellia]MBT9187397.1 rRNA pseudouridine synthase [Zobellia russellii]MBU2975381.1 rRNA pseudouridine synthase [Zobellia sp. B3R18]MDO6817704.1 pseudouridine synthase [Zobellia sp. 1_MG-2023]